MKKFLKIFGIVCLVSAFVLYSAFLFVLPNAVDITKYVPELQKIVLEQTNLKLDINNPKISVSPLLQAGIQADGLSLKLEDDSDILTADKITGRISLPSLLFLTIKLSKAEIINPKLNIDIVDGSAFKAVQAYEKILTEKESSIELKQEENALEENNSEQFTDILSKIKIVVPDLKLINYQALINDLRTGEYLKLSGEKLSAGYNNGKTASLKTNAEFFLNDEKKISADINIDTIIPEMQKLDEEDDKAQRIDIPFVNPISVYKDYDLKTEISSKLKIRKKNNLIVSSGYLNVDGFTLKLSDMQLPASMFHLRTKGTKAFIDTDLNITKNEKFLMQGMVNCSNKPAMDLRIKSDKIKLKDILNLARATLESLHVRNNLNQLDASGAFEFDTYIKTNFKKLKSNGAINIDNCTIKDTLSGKNLFKMNAFVVFDDNMLNIKDAIGEIAETFIKLQGSVNEKFYTDISLKIEKLPLIKLFSMFADSEIKKNFDIKSGEIDINASIDGEPKKAAANLIVDISNVFITDTKNKTDYSNGLLSLNFKNDFKTLTGEIINKDFKLERNGAFVSIDTFQTIVSEKDISIPQSRININNATNINFEGAIFDYKKKPIINFNADGFIGTRDIKRFLGNDIAFYLADSGILPVSLAVSGNNKKQTLSMSVDANKNAYITPLHLLNVKDKNTAIKTTVDFKGDRIKIKDTGLFVKNYIQSDDGELIVKFEEILGIDGTITGINTQTPNINLIKVRIPNTLQGVINVFPSSSLNIDGSVYIFGAADTPRMRGGFNIHDISIPELYLSAERLSSKFEGQDIKVDMKNLSVNGSDYNIILDTDIKPSEYFTINNLNIISKLTDTDKLMDVSNAAMSYIPAQNTQTTEQTQNDIPVLIKKGKANIAEIKTGNIVLTDTTSDIELKNNDLILDNIFTSAFKGTVQGKVTLGLLNGLISTNLKGTGLDIEQTLQEAAAMKDTISGTMNFDTVLSIKGNTIEEQMKNLKGTFDFTMKDGQLGPFGRLENLIMAENIRESSFFQSTIGSVIDSMLSFNTTKYNKLNGHLDFKDGIAKINQIQSEGDIMSACIFGDFDLINNKIDIKLRGRLGSQVSDSMGVLAYLNPVNLVKATPGMSLILGKIFFLFTEQVTNAEMEQIPQLGKDISDNNSTKFQVILRGDAAKPLSLVKSFKWLALESDIEKAKQHVQKTEEDEALRQAEEAAKAAEEAKPEIIKIRDKILEKCKNLWETVKTEFSQKSDID